MRLWFEGTTKFNCRPYVIAFESSSRRHGFRSCSSNLLITIIFIISSPSVLIQTLVFRRLADPVRHACLLRGKWKKIWLYAVANSHSSTIFPPWSIRRDSNINNFPPPRIFYSCGRVSIHHNSLLSHGVFPIKR
ncbi:hypothetical protein BDN72DRAFT_444572 [Pluteus cervinus]|uniref:Uncharacterized protein n=1 Tax=Pluteus cervinus TaxID=181527 RepID=A0ACD3BC22_9AGAR|nr:hypothetical protein BDN72DRAFT_444572 [Pluteus cervinus]